MVFDRDTIARNLRDARENCGLSQQAAAERVGLSRTLIAQIELGNRPVSDEEMGKFATLYNTSVSDLTGTQIPGDGEFAFFVFEFAPELLLTEQRKEKVSQVLALVEEASALGQTLGRRPRSHAPEYNVQSPRNAAEAIAQGERVAEQERRRLGLSSNPVGNLFDVASAQGVLTTSADLPDDVSSLFIRHRFVGSVVLVNSALDTSGRRSAILHGYAHALFERGEALRMLKPGTADQLVAKRATAFASAFLLPPVGIDDALNSIGKGQPSRRSYVVFDASTESPIRAEHRAAPGSQTISCVDVATIARRFGASYSATVYRLLTLGAISESDARELLNDKRRRAGEHYLAVVDAGVQHDAALVAFEERVGLKAEVLRLAIECYRRKVIKKDRLSTIAEQLQIPELSKARLLELAEAAR
jgi:Zn-dependent peptidase ImmA (M78 family)/DNA-binding XRE family transcriptional regulator